jgi:hypothetical protein
VYIGQNSQPEGIMDMIRSVLLVLAMMLFGTFTAMAQRSAGVLTGHVLDTAGRPVIGATIRLVGTTQGGISKAPDGRFIIQNIRIGDYKIRITAVGYKHVEYEVRIDDDQTTSIIAQFVEVFTVSDRFGCFLPLPMVRPERFGTISIITADELERMP